MLKRISISQFKTYLETPVSNAPLITFRITFGALMLFSTIRFWALGWIEDHYIHSKVQFKYFGFEWVQLLSPEGMYALHIAMLMGAFGIMLGWWYRWSAVLFFLSFTYVQLIDATYYLNHYYFVSLISFLLIFLPAAERFSLDSRRRGYSKLKTENSKLFILQVQVAIVYIYAGLAKINYTWLIEALPLRLWLPAHDTMPIVGKLLAHEWTPWLFAWGGMLYDCTIVFFLMWKKTRWWAFAAVVFFHSMVGALFQIGVFPIVMIGLVLIYFDGDWHEQLLVYWRSGLRWVKRIFYPESRSDFKSPRDFTPCVQVPFLGDLGGLRRSCLLLFFIFQLAFPWRYLLYDGNLFWNEEGYRFSWRVMLMEKAGTATFYVEDGKTGKVGVVNNGDFLCAHQEKQMAMQPDLILQFGQYLGGFYKKKGVSEPKVRVDAFVTLNGAPSQRYIQPDVDLMKIKDGWEQKKWVLPYNE